MQLTGNFAPPSPHCIPTCRHGPMSKWRQEGFVQDSDEEEEEAQLESQGSRRNAAPERRVERVEDLEEAEQIEKAAGNDVTGTRVFEEDGDHVVPRSSTASIAVEPQSPITRQPSFARPTASPLTPIASQKTNREPTESPDPLQFSPQSSFRRVKHNVSSFPLAAFKSTNSSVSPGRRQQNAIAISSQALDGPSSLNGIANEEISRPQNTSAILGAFGIEPLSDASSSDDLSDPPTDLESPETEHPIDNPHRRTAVQVVIPSSTALQRHIFEQESRREFRQRKPIQLHPYALESELYRREVQSRGLRPVPRPRSVEQRAAPETSETQEQDFDPNAAPDSSPPELEIPVSTPVVRRPQEDRPIGSPTRLLPSTSVRRRVSSTQLRYPISAKRRKLNVPSTQGENPSTGVFVSAARRYDIWTMPPNSPPYSSSPIVNGQHLVPSVGVTPAAARGPSLPTPSTSSVVLEDHQLLPDSESDLNPRRSTPASTRRHRPTRTIVSDHSSSVSPSSSEAEQSEGELRKVGRKIKGVLPASWLRFDQKVQERRQAQARERQRLLRLGSASIEPCEPQRGVAKRVLKRAEGMDRVPIANTPGTDLVVISDESDNATDVYSRRLPRNLHHSIEDATALAAAFDRQYADDDSDHMENDRLHLFTLGGTTVTRKKQTKLTDSFQRAKRPKAGDTTRKWHEDASRMRSQRRPKRAQNTTPPALSVVDVDLSPMKQSGNVPHFLRLARRQAIRRPDLARQSPKTKQLRLHNADDTRDANTILQQWQQGALRPKANVVSQLSKAMRTPLTKVTDNYQHGHLWTRNKGASKPHTVQSRPQVRERIQQAPVLAMFQRSPSIKVSQRSKKAIGPRKGLQRTVQGAALFRPGQLQEDENVSGTGYKKTAFEQGLRRADEMDPSLTSGNQAFMNPQLARFLADGDVALPPIPTAEDRNEDGAQDMPKPHAPTKKRLVRKKMRTQRIDADAREYRQPSEPTVQEIFIQNTVDPQEVVGQEADSNILHGLGPYGTHYPITFDISTLEADTYFHSSSLIGSEDLRCALLIGDPNGRNLDELAGYTTITHKSAVVRCGPWNDETMSALHEIVRDITAPLTAGPNCYEEVPMPILHESLRSLISFLRSLINYISRHISFSDPIDRKDFATKLHYIILSLYDQMSVLNFTSAQPHTAPEVERISLQVMAFLLVLSVQTSEVMKDTNIESNNLLELRGLAGKMARSFITYAIRKGIPELGNFLEQNRRHAIREQGIREDEVVVEGVVICMHALERTNLAGMGFWDIVSQELSTRMSSATHIGTFESAWASLFTLVPFVEVDLFGLPVKHRRDTFTFDNWACISGLLKRIFELYPNTYKRHGGSLNDYLRTNFARCHRLIKYWHWQRPEQMLNAVFDFFGKNGLRQLTRETTGGSVSFFDHTTLDAPLSLEPNESAFHIALKCLVLGLRGMVVSYTEKKIRSFVFRTIPNHGRNYPKDQPLDEESLAALRNHHDLLCTLYWAAPPPCRPKLELIRSLVSHESSHREACRVNVRAWANLSTFQLSTKEPYLSAKSFALWHKDIMHHTLRQYRLARTEADEYLKSGVLDGTSDISTTMVRQAMARNQEQVIATLRDCIAGMQKAMHSASDLNALDAFLVDCDIMHLMELPHLEDSRLVSVIRDTLMLLQAHAKTQRATSGQNETQQSSEDSQDYGDFPDVADLDDLDVDAAGGVSQHARFDFVQTPLWRLLSNAFGAEVPPDDNLLMACIDTWIIVADAQVKSGARSWSYYLESFSQVSWQQLRATDQTRKYGPYFLARLVEHDRTIYEEHRHEIDTTLLVSLTERESLLRFQHRLLHAIVQNKSNSALMRNIPFFYDQKRGDWDITSDTVRTRRLALISSLFSNMRDDLYATASRDSSSATELRRVYATMLKELMMRMQSNYLQLQQGSQVTGSFVEFVQKVVQFLKQYTGDICPVLPFFTDSVAFPLPSTDPTYVVGRLCGYASKAAELGTAKQLSVFIQTVAQQAAADNQQVYLVNQLTTALSSEETPANDRALLREVLFQGIFPAYLETTFSSSVASLIARPILHSLRPIVEAMMFDLRIAHPSSVSSILGSLFAILHAFIRGTEPLKETAALFEQPHALAALTQMLGVISSTLPILEYIGSRHITSTRNRKPMIVNYMEDMAEYIASMLAGMEPYSLADYEGGTCMTVANGQTGALLAFSKKGLQEGLKTNWSESGGTVFFGQGHAKREIVFDVGSLEEERATLSNCIEEFNEATRNVYGGGDVVYKDEGMGCDMVV
ncbi:Mus7/MMS22 family-domain-containing protein [Phaeosphaeria sp. MPI-PUGE-AT-0046c]|nr:Mus7/MMS22 family-domain-containing protein [Phaeosphaeria sp. MPI-PUGE-AT-0046c]